MPNIFSQLWNEVDALLPQWSCGLSLSALNLGVSVPFGFNIGASLSPTCGLPRNDNGVRSQIRGGRCNTSYTIFGGVTNQSGTTSDQNFENIQGPINNIIQRWIQAPDPGEPLRLWVGPTGPNVGNTLIGGILYTNERLFTPSISDNDTQRRSRWFWRGTLRLDGGADNCGDSPPLPPTPPTTQTDTLPPFSVSIGGANYTFNTSITTNSVVNLPLAGGLHLAATLNIQSNPVFPGGTSLPIFIRLADLLINRVLSGFPINISDITSTIGDIVFPPSPQPSQQGLTYTTRLIGVDVQCVLDPDTTVSTIVGTGGAPNLYVPRLAVVRFTPPPFVSSRTSVDINVKSLQQFVPAPFAYGAESYSILPSVGVTVTSTPRTAKVADVVKPA